jgi:chromate reductase, NAD(P)H dehydrogenase (quinone)
VIRLLAVCGSLRAASTNKALLEAAARLALAGMTIDPFDGLADLPPFNPDLDVEPLPPTVALWRGEVAISDGLLISSPEYARGVPGALKNALDWLVSSEVFPGKPVALFNASERGVAMQASLRLILETMSAKLVESAMLTVPLLGTQTDAAAIANGGYSDKIREALEAYARFLA